MAKKRQTQRGAAGALTVARDEANTELAFFLADRLELSRRRAKDMLDQRRVLVNGRRVWMARHRLKAGDRVEHPPVTARVRAQQTLAVLYKDAAVLVVNKPDGLTANGPRSVETLLQETYGAEARVAHRLDRHTTGALLATRSPDAFEQIVDQFRAGTVKKHYRAIVEGAWPHGEKQLTRSINAKRAVSVVHPLGVHEEASFLEVGIETGRTHQIRIHLSQEGYPVLGDREYVRGALSDIQKRTARQMLHAYALGFTSPDAHAEVQIQAPLPDDMSVVLKRYGWRA